MSVKLGPTTVIHNSVIVSTLKAPTFVNVREASKETELNA